MDDQFQKWSVEVVDDERRRIYVSRRQKSMFSSYQSQASLFNRMKNELIGLYAKIDAQDRTILSLNRDRFLLAKENASLSQWNTLIESLLSNASTFV